MYSTFRDVYNVRNSLAVKSEKSTSMFQTEFRFLVFQVTPEEKEFLLQTVRLNPLRGKIRGASTAKTSSKEL